MEAVGVGVFVEPEDSAALVQAVLNLAADPHRRQRMGISGRQYIVSKLSRERTAQNYLTVLDKLTGKEKGRGR